MVVSISWLRELVDLRVSVEELVRLLPLRTIGLREVTPDFFEMDMKGYNRADLLSLRGVAYEVSAITGSPVKFSEEESLIWQQQAFPATPVRVENNILVPLYCIAKIEGLKVTSSPAEWVKKLADSGLRTVNNVADVTNLIMLEYGQPLHAFDAAKITDQTLIVRNAFQDEKITTLDNKERRLTPADIIIADPQKPVGIAGVMGGKDSEITDSTSTILLEAAIFDPVTLRQTAQRLNLPSEASRRFQHGLTKKRLLEALNAAVNIYLQMGGRLTAVSIVGSTEENPVAVPYSPAHSRNLIGVDIRDQDMRNYLERLHFGIDSRDPKQWSVTPPYFRLDIRLEADLIEEVARLYGYENIPPVPLAGNWPKKIDQTQFDLVKELANQLCGQGLDEIQTYSFYSTAVINNLEINHDQLVRITNPMSAETEYMRRMIWPNLLEKAAENLKYIPEATVFEIGKVYLKQENKPPAEETHLAIALSDQSDDPLPKLWSVFEQINRTLNLQVEAGNNPSEDQELFHPVRRKVLLVDGRPAGIMGEVHLRVVNKFGSDKRIAALELNLDSLATQ